MITPPDVLRAAEYVAPAAKILTTLHVPSQEPGPEGQTVTRCGLVMDVEGLWLPVVRGVEPICRVCCGKSSSEEEGGLW